jgi:hypothetical protein
MSPLERPYLLERLNSIIQFARNDPDPQLEGVLMELERLSMTLQGTQRQLSSAVDEVVEAEFHSLLASHPKLQKAYLLGYLAELRQSASAAVQKIEALARSKELSDDEERRLRKARENLQKCDDFERHVKQRYSTKP